MTLKKLLLSVAFIFLVLAAWTQKNQSKDYLQIREQLNEKIFGTPDPYFNATKAPEEFKNESAVILAQKHMLESDSWFKVKLSLFGPVSGAKYNIFETIRERILINDKSALEAYSQINFTRLQSKSKGYLGKKKNYTFMNIRLIKPDGKMKQIDVDEDAVTIKAGKEGEQNKIAVPDLEVGDIIDYYITNYYQEEGTGMSSPYQFVLGDDYPVVNYILSLQFDSRMAVEYQSINGAPDFRIRPDEDGNGNILDMAVKNLPKLKGILWTSYFKQVPMLRLRYSRSTIKRHDLPDVRPGRVDKVSEKYPAFIEYSMAELVNNYIENVTRIQPAFNDERKELKAALKKYQDNHPKADNTDSALCFIYRYMSWMDFYSKFDLNTNFYNAYIDVDLGSQLERLARFADQVMILVNTDFDLLLVCPNTGFDPDNLFSVRDLTVLLRTRGPKPIYFSFGDNLDFHGSIPYYAEDARARVYTMERKSIMGMKYPWVDLTKSKVETLPGTGHTANRQEETLQVQLDSREPELLQINRTVSAFGNLKKDAQALMTIYEELALQSGWSVDRKDDLLSSFGDRSKAARKQTDELQTLLQKAKKKHKEDFENDIKRNFEKEPKELTRFAVKKFGFYGDEPFEYEEKFKIEGIVKKAGNNYIIDLGKLIAGQIAIEKEQRKRDMDVYMNYPRSFQYHISFDLPDGYKPEGIDRLAYNTSNEAGCFISKVQLDGARLMVDIEKSYYNRFEPAAKWPLMLGFLDDALAFNGQQVLLKKL